MKLPDIDMAGVQQVDPYSRVSDAQRKSLQTIEQGLFAFSKEIAATQVQKAKADLTSQLSNIHLDISSRPTVDTEYVRTALGGNLNALPPEVRSQVTDQAFDLRTGNTVEMDKASIPTWIVAGAVYEAQARKAMDAASQNITFGPGWQAEFQESAQAEFQARKAKLDERSREAMLGYLVETQTNNALTLANAGSFDEARKVVASSQAMDPKYKEKVLQHVEKVEQVRPVYEALQRDDVGAMATMLGELNDPQKFTALEPQERASFSERLKSEIKQFQAQVKNAKDDQLKAAAEAGWNGILAKQRAGLPVSFRDIPPPGTVHADEQRQMIEYVKGLSERKEVKTDLTLYANLTQIARDDPEAFQKISLTSMINQLSPSDFKHFADLQSHKVPGYTDEFVNTDEQINTMLSAKPYRLGPKDVKDNPEKAQQVGQIKSIVQHELAALGHRPTIQERDDIITRVIRDNVKVEKGFFTDKVKVDTGIPPKYVAGFRRVAADLGVRLDADGLKKTYDDFSNYEPGISDAWSPQSRKPLTSDKAIGVYGFLKAHWSEIDAELTRAGKPRTNENRTALAVQGYLSTTR